MKVSIFMLVASLILPMSAQAARRYVNVPRTCNISHVALVVTGDNIFIEDLDVLFGNGMTQYIPTRTYFRENSSTVWKDLNGGLRCIEGFWVKGIPDKDWNNARVHMYGNQVINGRSRSLHLGSGLIRDF